MDNVGYFDVQQVAAAANVTTLALATTSVILFLTFVAKRLGSNAEQEVN